MDIKEAKIVVRPSDLRPMAKQVVDGTIDKSSPLQIFKILRAAGKKIKIEKGGDTSRTGRKIVIEKSVSKAQQKFFGMVRAKQKGEMDDASPEVKKAADSMSKKDVEDFAKTKHKGLPDKVKESIELDEAVRVSRKDFDKLKKGSMITIDYGSSIRGSTKRTFMVKGKSRSAKYNVDKVNMVDPNKPGGMKFHLYSRDGEDATLALGDMGATINSYSIKESVDEAALKTSDYPKGTSMSARKFKDSQKKMSKQRALTTKDYPKGTSMSATAWKNRQEEVDEAKVRGADAYDKTFANRKQADKFAREMGGRVKQVGRVFYVFKESVDEASILRTKTTRKQSDASKEKDRKKAVKTFQNIRKGKYPDVKFAEETLDEASIQDIQGILTTIAKSQNMNQAVQMVMKKYKVDQGKAKAMVKKAIDSGVTYDKIKKKYAKESVELDEANAIDLARDVVKNKGAKKGLDMQTANAILTVYDKVNDANKKKMEKMPVAKLSSAVWKILGKAK